MNPGTDRSAVPCSSGHAAPGIARSQLSQHVVAGSVIAVMALAALTWKTAFADPRAEPLDHVTVASTSARAAVVAGSEAMAPLSPASSAASTGIALREMPPAIAQQLQTLSTAYEQLQRQSRATDERLHQLEADLASLRQQVEESRVAQLEAHRQAQMLARQLHTARAAAQTQAVQQAQATRVISVDTWDGRPSVSVQMGSEVRFFSEGDVVARALLRKADPTTQRVEFVNAAGAGMPAGGSVEQRP